MDRAEIYEWFGENDFSEKPSYRVLDRLINKEWQTNMEYDCREKFFICKMLHGKYEIEVCKGNTKVKEKLILLQRVMMNFI